MPSDLTVNEGPDGVGARAIGSCCVTGSGFGFLVALGLLLLLFCAEAALGLFFAFLAGGASASAAAAAAGSFCFLPLLIGLNVFKSIPRRDVLAFESLASLGCSSTAG